MTLTNLNPGSNRMKTEDLYSRRHLLGLRVDANNDDRNDDIGDMYFPSAREIFPTNFFASPVKKGRQATMVEWMHTISPIISY